MTDTVLVTGISGFIASHVAAGLLGKGFLVRGTVRNLDKGQRILHSLASNGADTSRLELIEANLDADTGWKDAVTGCRFVQHIASPFPLETPSNREALVPEARAGAMRVVEQAIGAGAERVVMTSSMVAMMGQPGRGDHMLVTENDWSDPDWRPLTAYPVSKTRAERAVWDYAETQNVKSRITTVNPGLVFGPDTYNNGGTSLRIISAMFSGEFPRTPKVAWPISDVRDIAATHIAAMTAKDAGGRRLIAAGQTLWLEQVAKILMAEYPRARKLPKGDMPNWLVKMVGIFDTRVKALIPDLGTFHEADAAYVTGLTGVIPRPAKDAVLSAAESLIENGLVVS